VQGVGFRPTVFRYAVARNLSGWVTNTSTGVVIEVEGSQDKIEDFILTLKKSPPPRAEITNILLRKIPLKKETVFQVLPSIAGEKVKTRISPEIATCQDCLEELFNPQNRRYLYPFINCTNCGPRFTIIKNIPYDRKNTTMKKFTMCALCQEEYDNPRHRRFHAQPNACPVCGPQVILAKVSEDSRQELGRGREAVENTVRLLQEGKIVAIKGLGGFHLACDATNDEAVRRLRQRKYREDKPFALMADSLATILSYCEISPEEMELLTSFRTPIVLLRRRESDSPPLSENIAPRNRYLGFMLPYTPLHHLLFHNSPLKVLVMTSGNVSDEPIAYENEEAVKRLQKIADYFLLHNRDIYMRLDDSVSRILPSTGEEYIMRRSRGYVPEPIKIQGMRVSVPILACGGHTKNTFAIASEDEIILSHHIGDMENMETYKSFTRGIEHFKKLLKCEIGIIAHDLHPEYLSTKYVRELIASNPRLISIPIQHHHAHVASVMLDNGLGNEKVIGIAFDGTGFGSDGNLWGGEFLIADYCEFARIAHLQYIPLPGGEGAIKEPWRVGAACLHAAFGESFLALDIEFVRKLNKKTWNILKKMMDKGINTPLSSSMGRFFDGVSSLLCIRDRVNYEGQAAIELEMTLSGKQSGENQVYEYRLERDKEAYVIATREIVRGIVEDLKKALPVEVISLKFHRTIVALVVDMAKKIREETGLQKVALSGGVFQNMFLLGEVQGKLKEEGFTVFLHKNIPTNDGGLSAGQAIIAAYRKEKI